MKEEALTDLFKAKLPPRGADLAGDWYSKFQPNFKRDELWYPERMAVKVRNGCEFVCQSVEGKEIDRFNWVALGTIYKGQMISGKWASKIQRRQMAGTFILNIDPSSARLHGFLLGERDADRAANYGAWVLARAEADWDEKRLDAEREAAEIQLAEQCPTLLEVMMRAPDKSGLHPETIRESAPRCPELVTDFIAEAVQCARIGSLQSSAFMVGAASEIAINRLIDVYTEAIADDKARRNFADDTNCRKTTLVRWEKFRARYEKRTDDMPPKSHEWERTFKMVLGTYEFCRMTRDMIAHPKEKLRLDQGEISIQLSHFKVYIQAVNKLIEFYEANKIA